MKFLILCLFLLTFAGFSNDCGNGKEKKNVIVSNASRIVESETSPTPAPEKVSVDKIRQGENGGFNISWSKENIIIKNISSGQTVFSAREFAMMRLKKDFKGNFDKNGEPYFEDFTFRYQIVSIAGNLLSLHEKTSYSPQSYSRETFLTIDLSKSPQTVSLIDFFTEKEILNALVSNEMVSAELKRKNLEKPVGIAEFRNNFNKSIIEATEVSDNQLDKCWFPESVFKSFAFDKARDGKLIVDLAIPCRADMREDGIYTLKLILQLPEKLINKKILSGDFENSVSNNETVITFNSDSLKWE